MKEYVKALNHIYQNHDALWANDHDWNGFSWISADDADNSVFTFVRKSDRSGEQIITVINLTPNPLPEYIFGAPAAGTYSVLLNSDDSRFGGSDFAVGADKKGLVKTLPVVNHGQAQSLKINIPPLSSVLLQLEPK